MDQNRRDAIAAMLMERSPYRPPANIDARDDGLEALRRMAPMPMPSTGLYQLQQPMPGPAYDGWYNPNEIYK